MIKTIFIFFSYLAFLLLGIFSSDTVLIENNTPAMLSPGVRTLVEVNVRKGDVQGFSKLELTLPDGFLATPGDIKGASFTFSGDKAKFVWMNLPEEDLFKVPYYLESEPGVEGAYDIKGTFSYVRGNIREDIYVPTRTVVVKEYVDASVDAPVDALVASVPVVRVEEPVLEMSCERRVERMGDNEYLVRLKVNNNRINGFGKILEVLPDNCSTNRDNDGGAVITQDANSIKFVWFEVPTAPSFEISYRVMCISDGTVPVIRGQLSYTENGNPFTVDVIQLETPSNLEVAQTNTNTTTGGDAPNTSIDSSSTANAQTSSQLVDTTSQNATTTTTQTSGGQNANTTSTANTTSNTSDAASQNGGNTVVNTTPVVAANTQKTEQNGNQTQSNSEANSAKNQVKNQEVNGVTAARKDSETLVNTVPSAEKGITYKVQILAAHRVVDKSYLKKKFSFEENYNIENHNGWVKYTTGMYTQYKDARDARVKITTESSKLPGPFVTAYNDGERITVQEALLISKQLWYK
jgi:hypothetical protein